jgi:phosphate starvation-inducible PhoH-like protein
MANQSGQPATTRIVVPGAHNMVSLLGSSDELLRLIERAFTSDIHVRGNEITITGDQAEVALASRLFEELITLLERGDILTADAVTRSLAMLRQQTEERPADVLSLNIISSRGRTIRPKTLNQKKYVDAIDAHTVVFGIGPAGTGKTYLAMAKAVQALQAKHVNRIILTRPAVEAGERLGFLPGTLSEKIDPYLRPLYDALHDMVDPDSIPRLMANGTIEVAPLAFMRGRSINDSFVILDEAQNTSPEQMKMFLTRLGFGSKMVVTGDVTQVDLPTGQKSGLKVVQEILRHRRRLRQVGRGERRRRTAPGQPATSHRPLIPDRRDDPVEHRHPERVRRRRRRARAREAGSARSRRDAGASAGRALGPPGRRRRDDGPARALHERAGTDRRARVSDGRAARPTRRRRGRRRAAHAAR